MTAEILVLRIVHVVGGVFWVGTAVFTAFFLGPALAGSGPAAGAVMAGLQQRRMFTVLPVVALLTIVAGLRLMWIGSAGFAPGYFAAPTGLAFGLGGLAAVIAFLLSLLVMRPAMMRSGRLAASLGGAADEAAHAAIAAELGALRRRGAVSSTVAAVLLVLSAVAMAVARYL